ncbi:MAG: PadR family transcriptional regulator [Anaerolineae bacterium]|nr:PadR family transcriptional regulator [Anaerolineae bacterium]
MSLDYAILGFLNYHPYSGYDLKKVLDMSVRHFWTADQSQIYRTLSRLMEQGYLRMEKLEQDERPDKKLYHITPAGQAALLAWLAGPPPLSGMHSGPMVQVFFMAELSDEEVLRQFEGYAHIMRSVLAQYEQVPEKVDEVFNDVRSPRDRFFWLLTLDNGLRNMRANLEWAETAIKRIKQGQLPPGSSD